MREVATARRPAEEAGSQRTPPTQRMLTLTIRYFAILREQRGQTEERLSTPATTPAELYAELKGRHDFTLPGDRVRAAVDGEFVLADAPLRDGQVVVFIPPVAGG